MMVVPGAAMANQQIDYVSYLLRLWRVKEEERDLWHASLENTDTSQRRGFANLDQLFEFLREVSTTKRGPKNDEGGIDSRSS
jgi:hypothetical protein